MGVGVRKCCCLVGFQAVPVRPFLGKGTLETGDELGVECLGVKGSLMAKFNGVQKVASSPKHCN
jgi:hypothetical protein